MTIYALSTGPGISGVAIIRISGEQSSKIIVNFNRQKSSSAKSSNIKKNQ
jgi:tRNA modification GTPase